MFLSIQLASDRGPRYRQIYQAVRDGIMAGKLRHGDKLPSSRELARELCVARTVVLAAFEHLLAEGYAEARQGTGTFVSARMDMGAGKSGRTARVRYSRFARSALGAWSAMEAVNTKRSALSYDFSVLRSESELFPLEQWRRLFHSRMARMTVRGLEYGPAGGADILRSAIADLVRRTRAVECDPSRVIVVNGSQQALDLIVRVLVEPGDRVAVEDPCYRGTRELLRAAGAELCAVPVDEHGIVPDKIPAGVRAVFVTPSHQFPTGAQLSLERRVELLALASRRNALIVEDDYNGEFRYDGRRLEALQALDREGRVLYVGTFSRTIYSALRVGYLVAPAALVPALSAAKWLCDRHTATLTQETLADFISCGAYERYLRRALRGNTARRRVVLEAIESRLGNRVHVTGDGAGTHLVLWPEQRVNEQRIVRAAAVHGVGIVPLSRYYAKKPARSGFLLHYAGWTEVQIREGIRRLALVL